MKDLIFHAINLVALLTIIVFFARKKLNAHFAQQAEDFRNQVKEANQQFEEMKARYDTLKGDLAHLEGRLSDIRQQNLRDIEHETQRIETEANEQVQRSIQEGEQKIRTEGDRIKMTLEKELLERAIELARARLAKEIPAKEDAWVQDFLESDNNVNAAGRKNYAS